MSQSLPPAAPAKTSLVDDLVDIFTSPAEVFRRRMGSNSWPLLIILSLCLIGLFLATRGVMQPVFDAEWARAVARAEATNPQAATAMAGARGMVEKFQVVGVILAVPVSVLFIGVVLWLVGKIFGAMQTVGDAMMVATYAYIPRILGGVVGAAMAMLMDASKLNSMFAPSLSVARFLDPDATPHALFQLAGRLDVFVLWQTALLGIGLSVTGKIPRLQGYIAAALMWLVGTGAIMGMQR